MSRKKLLIVCSTKEEAEKSLELNNQNTVILALTLEAEFLLQNRLEGYVNPLVPLTEMSGYVSSVSYFSDNFRLAHKWYQNENYKFIQDRLGFFLMEFDKSMDFVEKVFDKYRPEELVIPPLISYKNASVINGSLIPHAFFLRAKEKSIKVSFFPQQFKVRRFMSDIGKLVQKARYAKKIDLDTNCDLLILAPPRHLLQMQDFIEEIERNNIKHKILTYNVTYFYKNKFDKLFNEYFEKERLSDNKLVEQANDIYKDLIKNQAWVTFVHPKYRKRKIIMGFIKGRIKQYVLEELRQIIVDRLLADKILKSTNPKLLLTVTDPDTNALTFIEAAKKMKIKTLSFQHGADFTSVPYSLPVSDNYIVWSSNAREWILRNNYTNTKRHYPNKKISVGRSPYHKLVKPTINNRRGKVNILFLATIHFFDRNLVSYYQQKLFKSLEELSNIELAIRPYPNQNIDNLEALASRSNFKSYLVQNKSLKDCINGAQVVIFENTTAALDALLMKKPCVFFNPYDGQTHFRKKDNTVVTILNSKEIESKLLAFLVNKNLWKGYAERGQLFAVKYAGLDEPFNRNIPIIKNLLK